MKRIVYPTLILLFTSSNGSAEWKYRSIEAITNEKQAEAPAESFINNDCKPDSWGDFSGFITQPGLEGQPYNLYLLCRPGKGKAGHVSVKVVSWHGPEDFLHNTIEVGGFANITVLGMSLGETVNSNIIYFAVPE